MRPIRDAPKNKRRENVGIFSNPLPPGSKNRGDPPPRFGKKSHIFVFLFSRASLRLRSVFSFHIDIISCSLGGTSCPANLWTWPNLSDFQTWRDEGDIGILREKWIKKMPRKILKNYTIFFCDSFKYLSHQTCVHIKTKFKKTSGD